jgi:chromosomal replication initiator protein
VTDGQATNPPISSGTNIATRLSRKVAEHIGTHKYDMWFHEAQLHVDGAQVIINTPSSYAARWIETHFGAAVRSIAREELGEQATITIRPLPGRHATQPDSSPSPEACAARAGDDARTNNPPGSPAPPDPPSARTPPRTDRRHWPRLDDFVTGSCNRLAYTAVRRLSESPDAMGLSPLFIHGGCGLGKTHLLQSCCREAEARSGRRAAVRYVTAEQFTNEYIASVRSSQLERFRKRYRSLDVLAIDDVHFLASKVKTQQEFLHTIDEIGFNGSRIVLASDNHPQKIKSFRQALVSRFLSGMVAQIDMPDYETRLALTRHLAAQRGITLSDGAVDMIAQHCVGSVREILGAISKLSAMTMVMQDHAPRPTGSDEGAPAAGSPVCIDGALTQRLIANGHAAPRRPIRVDDVLTVVLEELAVPRRDLLGSTRQHQVVLARGLVAFLARELTTHSYPEIARAMGRSHHSTVHTASTRLTRQLEQNASCVLPGEDQPRPLREVLERLRLAIRRRVASNSVST